ncbi:MAG TPA: flagellar biosynthetic protein FliP, partial [Elusimicrobiota bacterium]|nr:flagellar biosynthetic protein FliP [Elusimicrobiota bacterium]
MKAKALPWVLPILLAAGPVLAAAGPADGLLRSLGEPKRLSSAMETVVVLTILSLIPTVLILTTCFLRFSLVLGFARQALSLQQTPPNHVLISLAMVLTFFVMGSTLKTINDTAVQPYRQGKLAFEKALEIGAQPLREFLLKQTRRRELSLAVRLARLEPKTEADVPFHV